MKMFGDIRKVFADKKAVTKDYVEALYDFLLQIHMYEKLEARKNELYEETGSMKEMLMVRSLRKRSGYLIR